MRILLLGLFTLGILSAQAQDTASIIVPEKALMKLEKMRKQTEAEVIIGKRGSSLPPETRPVLNRILLQSANEFVNITARKPTKEAYFKIVDAGLTRLTPLMPKLEDREQVAEYYQDLLDIVGLESSEGRLTAFVEGTFAKP